MSRTTRPAFLFLATVFVIGVAGGCKSSNCSSCGAQAPAAVPAIGERAPAVATAPKIDSNIRLAAATVPSDDCAV